MKEKGSWYKLRKHEFEELQMVSVDGSYLDSVLSAHEELQLQDRRGNTDTYFYLWCEETEMDQCVDEVLKPAWDIIEKHLHESEFRIMWLKWKRVNPTIYVKAKVSAMNEVHKELACAAEIKGLGLR